MEKRETFTSRLGFILISAGCAIGLGNVWRFPYVAGMYGGAVFVGLYILFLILLGLPILVMEFAVGRASRKSAARSFHLLEPAGTKWHWFRWISIAGNYLLMMFYTTIAGWMLAYLFFTLRGDFIGITPGEVSERFTALTGDPIASVGWMVAICVIGFSICALGLRNGVERSTKFMMTCLLAVMAALAVRAVTLPGAVAGLSFYLKPNLSAVRENGVFQTIYAAMGQAFFTLSVGVGSMAIFGSYIGKERKLLGEGISVTVLDTFVAVVSGLIIFPACFAFGINPGEGPGLVFVTLPNIFNAMPLPRLWGSLFFVFMTFAALSTVIAVFENIVSFTMDLAGIRRKKACLLSFILLVLLSLPCALGFNLLSSIQPLGRGTNILDLEDFLVSNNLLPLGALVYLLFCVSRYGWGWDGFMKEANTGKGLRFPRGIRPYLTYVLPVIVLLIFLMGYAERFVFTK